MSQRIFEHQPGWVINPIMDVLAFYVPLVAAFCFRLSSSNIFFTKVGFDIGHLFVTVIPLYYMAKAGTIEMKPLLLKPVLVLLAAQIVCYFYFNLFTYCFGYYALYHVCAQLYGWLAKIQRTDKELSPFEIIFERIFLGSMLLSSVLFWHTAYAKMPRGWFYDNNLIFEIPTWAWRVSDYIFLIMLVSWIGMQAYFFAKRKYLPIGKNMLLLAVWIMFYYSLVLNTGGEYGTNFFWFAITANHGLSYILFIFTTSQKRPTNKTALYFAGYFAAVFLVGALWQMFFRFAKNLDLRYGATLLWGPLIMHYTLDTIIWRRSFRRKLAGTQ
jgi:hypothetical protein